MGPFYSDYAPERSVAQLTDSVRHAIWHGTYLRVLDQRELPRRTVYIDCRSAGAVAKVIANMALRGAPLIGCAAAYGMALAARSRSHKVLKDAAQTLLGARPTAVNLSHAVNHMLSISRGLDGSKLPARLRKAAEDYRRWDLEANRRMAKLGASLLRKNSRIITHCNAGALATSGIGTSLGVIRQGFKDGKVSHVYPCETRPYLQGSRLTLWELMREKIPSTLITDNMAAHLMSRTRVDAVIVGSDRIAANADVCNKIGTYGLAILARHHRIPFYVVAPTTTIDMKARDGSKIPLEERSPKEVLEFAGIPIAPKGARAHHFAFDVTPHRLVSAIVTEKGIVRPVSGAKLKEIYDA